MVPSVKIKKADGQTGSVRPSPVGVLAIIASAFTGAQNVAQGFARQDLALAAFGYGPLVEYGAYDLAVAGNPFIAVRPTTAQAAAYGSITVTGGGTSVVTAGPDLPADDYQVLVTFITGGTVGTSGITYTYSLDGGDTVSAEQALGTASTLGPLVMTRPGGTTVGVSFALAAGTILVGETIACNTTHARMNSGDLSASLEALRVTTLPWEGVLIDLEVGTGTVAAVDLWLAGLETHGKFRFAVLNTRHKNLPVPSAETEGAFLTAMTALVSQSASERVVVGTDAGDLPSPVTGLVLPRPVSLAVAALAMAIPIGQDPAYVAPGPVEGYTIADANSNPKWHDESLYPGLDDQRLTTFRSIDGQIGTYITNALVLSTPGSDYVYLQHVRTMNRACEIAFQELTRQLSLGVGKRAPDQTTGAVYILEQDAQRIEGLVTVAVQRALKGQVVAAAFILSRTDDLSPNSGATLSGDLDLEALAYIKGFAVTAKFQKSIKLPS